MKFIANIDKTNEQPRSRANEVSNKIFFFYSMQSIGVLTHLSR